MPLGKLEKRLPVRLRDRVLPRMLEEAQRPGNQRRVQRRQDRRPDILFSQQPVNRARPDQGQKFTMRISPLILRSARHENGSRRIQRDQRTAVHRQVVPPPRILWKRRHQPPRKIRRYIVHAFPKVAPRQRRPHLTRATRKHQGDPRITRSRPQRRLPQPRVPRERHPRRVHGRR